MNERYRFLYVCGVGSGPKDQLYKQNVHLPLIYVPGRIATATTYNGYLITARNALELRIPPLPGGWNGLDESFTRCKNFRFGVAAFGYPPNSLEND